MAKQTKSKKTRKNVAQYTPMKKQTFWQNIKAVPLVLLCYVVVLIVWLASSTFSLAQDSILKASGNLETKTLQVADFEIFQMELQQSGEYKTTSDDPQMHLVADGTLRTLRYSAQYNNASNPLEICLYYTTNIDEPFSDTKRVWPTLQDDGSYLFKLPRTNITKVRLDPSSNLTYINFSEIIINEQQPLSSFYNPGWGGFITFLLLPGVAAAALYWLINVLKRFFPHFFADTKLNKKNAKFKKPQKL